jgi:hypothetical protein
MVTMDSYMRAYLYMCVYVFVCVCMCARALSHFSLREYLSGYGLAWRKKYRSAHFAVALRREERVLGA